MVATNAGHVFVGISLSNKSLTADAVHSAVALSRSLFHARHIAFLIADELELINLRVFDHGTPDKFDALVSSRAAVLGSVISDAMRTTDGPRIGWSLARWRDILNREYWTLYTELLGFYVESVSFRTDVNAVAREFAQRRARPLSIGQLHHLSLYLIAELPTLLQGVRIGSRKFQKMIYPARGGESLDRITELLASGAYGTSPVPRVCEVHRLAI